MKQDINSTVNQLFFHLLSTAIWDKEADAALFEGLDDKTWKQIAEMAIRQSVSALIADNKYVDMIFKEVLQSGNFGYYRSGKQRPKEKYSGMWFSFKNTLLLSLKFGAISPEHIRILPYTKLIYRLKIGFK